MLSVGPVKSAAGADASLADPAFAEVSLADGGVPLRSGAAVPVLARLMSSRPRTSGCRCGGYHLPSLASHQPGPGDVSVMR
jgi:hypothetical protein